MIARMHEYQVIGRKTPTEIDPAPKLFRMRVFAPNPVIAKSRYWSFMRRQEKFKRACGEIINVVEVCCLILFITFCLYTYIYIYVYVYTYISFFYEDFIIVIMPTVLLKHILYRSKRRTQVRLKTLEFGLDTSLAQELLICTRSSVKPEGQMLLTASISI